MCYTCGCMCPYDTMGDPRNITEQFFVAAGQTAAIDNAGVVEAKKNMLELLKAELAQQELDVPAEKY